MRNSTSPGENRYILSKGSDQCVRAAYGLYTSSNGGVAFYVSDHDNFYRSPEAPATVWDGKWHNVAGTFDGTTVRLYVDGKQIGNGTQGGADRSTTGSPPAAASSATTTAPTATASSATCS